MVEAEALVSDEWQTCATLGLDGDNAVPLFSDVADGVLARPLPKFGPASTSARTTRNMHWRAIMN